MAVKVSFCFLKYFQCQLVTFIKNCIILLNYYFFFFFVQNLTNFDIDSIINAAFFAFVFQKILLSQLFENQWSIHEKGISNLNKKKLVPFLVARQPTKNTI